MCAYVPEHKCIFCVAISILQYTEQAQLFSEYDLKEGKNHEDIIISAYFITHAEQHLPIVLVAV